MEREYSRERNPGSLGCEESQVVINSRIPGRDVRERLFSVFIDNLNPRLDSLVLWEFFRLYGKVRDVFLSSKKSSRRSSFGFIRFDTMEEATNVVKLVGGKLIFGWPIRAKMASFGWNCRRFSASKQNGGKEFDVSKQNVGKDTEVMSKLSYGEDRLSLFREDRGGIGTFTEVGKKNQMCVGDEIEKVWEMSWNSKDNEDIWLSKCAVGVLKEFGKVYSVNHRLSTRGLSFSSKYLGDKRILWIFDSEVERDGFVQNRFLWDDKFISMVKGTDPSTTHSRLAWINCEGVPLRYWKPEFFSKLSWLLGEPVLIEQETMHKQRFDRGKILVLLPLDQSCSGMIKVSVGEGAFLVKIMEDSVSVEPAWMESFLGLSTVPSQDVQRTLLILEEKGSSLVVNQGKGALGRDTQVGGDVKSDYKFQADMVLDSSLAKDRLDFGVMKPDSFFSQQLKLKGGNFSTFGGVLSDSSGEKAVKEVWSSKPYDRSSLSLVEYKAALSSSSSVKKHVKEGLCLNFKFLEGEQACWPTRYGSRKYGLRTGQRRKGFGGFKEYGSRKNGLRTGQRRKGFGGFKDFKEGFRKVASLSLSDVGLGSKEKSQDGKVVLHLSPVINPNWSSYLAVKGHVMKCRNSKNNLQLSLNFEDEISRIIRFGVAMGMDFDGKKVGLAAVFAELKRNLKLGG